VNDKIFFPLKITRDWEKIQLKENKLLPPQLSSHCKDFKKEKVAAPSAGRERGKED
jgi:hypothetical protein